MVILHQAAPAVSCSSLCQYIWPVVLFQPCSSCCILTIQWRKSKTGWLDSVQGNYFRAIFVFPFVPWNRHLARRPSERVCLNRLEHPRSKQNHSPLLTTPETFARVLLQQIQNIKGHPRPQKNSPDYAIGHCAINQLAPSKQTVSFIASEKACTGIGLNY